MIGQDPSLDYSSAGAAVALPDGSGDAIVASFDPVNGTIYLTDGRFIAGDGLSIIDPASGSVTWIDANGNWHTDRAAAISGTDPTSGQPTTLQTVLDAITQTGSALGQLGNMVRSFFGGSWTPAGQPIYVGNNQWRLPSGAIVTGSRLPSGLYQLSTGQTVAAPPSGLFAGLGSLGGLGVLALVGLGIYAFSGKRKRS